MSSVTRASGGSPVSSSPHQLEDVARSETTGQKEKSCVEETIVNTWRVFASLLPSEAVIYRVGSVVTAGAAVATGAVVPLSVLGLGLWRAADHVEENTALMDFRKRSEQLAKLTKAQKELLDGQWKQMEGLKQYAKAVAQQLTDLQSCNTSLSTSVVAMDQLSTEIGDHATVLEGLTTEQSEVYGRIKSTQATAMEAFQTLQTALSGMKTQFHEQLKEHKRLIEENKQCEKRIQALLSDETMQERDKKLKEQEAALARISVKIEEGEQALNKINQGLARTVQAQADSGVSAQELQRELRTVCAWVNRASKKAQMSKEGALSEGRTPRYLDSPTCLSSPSSPSVQKGSS